MIESATYHQQKQLSNLLKKTTNTLEPFLTDQIKNKYRTFTRFNYREAYLDSKKVKSKKQEVKENQNKLTQALKMFIFSELGNPDDKKKKNKKKQIVIEQLAGVKSERRERFKKIGNIVQIMKHYIQKQNFKPRQQQMYLIQQLSEIKDYAQQNTLDNILKKIYKIMNEAVDLNQLRFLSLLIMLAADICYQFKDLSRAFYFYNEAKLLSSYTQMYYLKTQSLIAMGHIALQIKLFNQSIRILKKALQYSWRIKNIQQQLLIYDSIGNCYYYQGNLRQSVYYHKRFTQGQFQNNESAIKKISLQMLTQYQKQLHSLQKKNITSLLIQYINIPIVNPQTVHLSNQVKKNYQNYDQIGQSPRKKRGNKIFQFSDFADVIKQINKLLDDLQFQTQIPDPDVQSNFLPAQSFGKHKKDIAFQQTTQFHKIIKQDNYKIDLSKLHSSSLQKRIDAALSTRSNNDWWEKMRDKIRKNQIQNVGRLRDKVFNSHQSYYKYPEQRRRSYSLKNDKIKQSFNKTLLDWIDPIK